ncbi:MAG: hypothetical protein LBR91_00235, partial [Puniceicoccales bacterium]|nr:hypothetical protein [Puniceicoccales bacterium]
MYLLANLTVIAGEKKDKPIGVNYFDTFKYEGTCSGPGENNPPRIETYAPRPGDTVYRAEFYNKDLHAYIYAGLVKVQQNGANSYGMMPVSICDCELVQNGNVIQSVVFNQWSLSSRHVNHISYDSRLVPSTSLTDFEQSKHHLPSLACLGQYVSPSDLCLPPPNHSVKIKQYVPPSNMPPLDSCISEIDLPCSSQTDLSYGESQNNQPAREYGDTTISPDDDYDD